MYASELRPRRWQFVGTIAILVLSTVAVLIGLFRPAHYRDTPYFLAQIFGQDVVTLGFGVPLLAIGLWLARHGSLRGYIIWLGSLGYMLYTWASYALMLYFNEFFLGYVTLFGLSLYVFVGGLLDLDVGDIDSERFARVPDRGLIAYLVGMGAFIGLGWLADIVPATLSGGVPETVELGKVPTSVIYAIDLAILLPAVIIVAWWVWDTRVWGYVFSGVILVKFLTLGLAVMAMEYRMWQASQGGVPAKVAMFGIIVLVSAVLGGMYLRALGHPSESSAVDQEGFPG